MIAEADLLVVNGLVRTMDPALPRASAVAVRDGRIAFVGDEAGARSEAGDRAQVLDCRAGLVLPGLVDSHVHFKWFAESLASVDAGTATLAGALERVREHAQRAGSGPARWITGSHWDHNRWDRLPSREDLDRVAPGVPIALEAKSGHALWVSSAALAAAGIGAGTHDPPGGRIDRTASGEPTGILYERAMELVFAVIPKPTVEETAGLLRQAQRRAHEAGLTGICDFDNLLAFRAFELLESRGEIALRVLKGIPREGLGPAIELGLRSGFGSPWLRIGHVKLFADGALGSRTAWMLEPFEGTSDRGIATMERDELAEEIGRATAGGLACAVHAIGDAANRAVLDAFERARAAEGPGARPRLPHRIEHAQLVHPGDFPRLARLGIVASMQPIHATSDMEIAERWWGARCESAYAWRTMAETGTPLAFGSDSPVETLSPIAGIHAAVTRRRPDGSPGPAGWRPGERLSVEEAVLAYTRGAAVASGRAGELGEIAVGRLADLTVLDRDIFSIDAHGIREAAVRATVVGGQVVWTADR